MVTSKKKMRRGGRFKAKDLTKVQNLQEPTKTQGMGSTNTSTPLLLSFHCPRVTNPYNILFTGYLQFLVYAQAPVPEISNSD
jgi:hypothetical protein